MRFRRMTAVVAGMSGLVLGIVAEGVTATPDAARQQQLLHLLKQDCGSCHGMTLKGGLGPDLLASRLATLPREFLVTTIAKGRPGTPMPPWETLLSADDIGWLVDELQRGIE